MLVVLAPKSSHPSAEKYEMSLKFLLYAREQGDIVSTIVEKIIEPFNNAFLALFFKFLISSWFSRRNDVASARFSSYRSSYLAYSRTIHNSV